MLADDYFYIERVKIGIRILDSSNYPSVSRWYHASDVDLGIESKGSSTVIEFSTIRSSLVLMRMGESLVFKF